ncbi:uncharacterized protein LTR77_007762 [Saxophila tyrrhenica]|uniref:Fe2OG dioxygenase domain-containing protein n=1 Tax=Saxophila tyrrhenica TaxID=1690608 RepID=A0AAV9P6X8_9PEZI|nr:hypothetical protein LTR77_007762 [Saxophila tyrrhenica]
MPHREDYTEFTPEQYPPFPDSQEFPGVELKTISLQKLLDHDSTEEDRVFEACKGRGFFYLELGGPESGETILKGSEEIARVGERFMALPNEEKMKFTPNKKELFGYKMLGATKVDSTGTRDSAEFFNVSKNDMIVPDNEMVRPWPKEIMEKKSLFADYSRSAHGIGMLVMDVLARQLGIDPEEIKSRHKIEERAGDHVRLTRGPPRKTVEMPEIQTPSHTDFGTITILMNWLGGLQVWSESSRKAGPLEPDVPGEWLWVKPKKGCAIVNLGDAAVKFTNGVLCSGRHRVIPSPGEQGKWPRYSIVYFVRPVDHSRLKTLKGKGVPPADDMDEEGVEAKEWIFQQAMALGSTHIDQKN